MSFGRFRQEKFEKHVKFIADNFSCIIPSSNDTPKEDAVNPTARQYMEFIRLVYDNV